MGIIIPKPSGGRPVEAKASKASPSGGSSSRAKASSRTKARAPQRGKASLPMQHSTNTAPAHVRPQERMLSIEQAAEYLQVCKKTVRNFIRDGELRAHKIGRQWRIAWDEMERFLATRSIWKRYGS